MHYCNNCILPDTRPNLKLNSQGICNACEAHLTKAEINKEKFNLFYSKRKDRIDFENSKSLSKMISDIGIILPPK